MGKKRIAKAKAQRWKARWGMKVLLELRRLGFWFQLPDTHSVTLGCGLGTSCFLLKQEAGGEKIELDAP